MKKQSGSAHVIIIIILVAALLGSLGFIFWQNFVSKNSNTESKEQQRVEQNDKESESIHPDISEVNASKKGIASATNDNLKGLSGYMVSPLGGAIANSDGIFSNKTNEELVSIISDYFGASNPDLAISGEWTFSDFKDLNNDKLAAQLKASSFTDYTSSYIGVAESKGGEDVFIAYSLNDKGLITYAFWGIVLGY